MPVNEFEKQVQQKMDELKIAPSAEVWTEVEKRIRKEKKRRRIIFWWLFPSILLLGGGVFYFSTKSPGEKTIAQNEQSQQQISIPSAPNPNQTENTNTPVTEDRSATKTNEITNSITSNNSTTQIGSGKSTQIAGGENSAFNVINARKKVKVKETASAARREDKTEVKGEYEVKVKVEEAEVKEKEEVKGEVKVKVKEEVKIVKQDSAVVTPDPIPETPNDNSPKPVSVRKRWIPGVAVKVGSSGTPWGALFNGGQKDLAYSAPSTGSGSGSAPPVTIQAPENGLSFGLEFSLQKNLSKRLEFRAAAHYDYYSTHILAGTRIDSTRQVFNDLSNVYVDNYYRPSTSNMSSSAATNYTNKYHFVGLSAMLSWKVISKKKFSLSWENGFSVSQLISSNALLFDPSLRAYYQDFQPFKKTQVFFNSGLSVPVWRNRAFTLSVNPFVSVGMSTVLKERSALDAYYSNYGIGLRFLFPSKK